jgi:FKBP-type peptidyl-prolyl cis-trans isomerase 2
MSKVEKGNHVKLHYRGTLATDGTEFDNSRARNEPLNFQAGVGTLIPGFDNAVVGMTVGESKTVTIDPENAYGPVRPEAKMEIGNDQFPENLELTIGMPVPLTTSDGRDFMGTIAELNESTVTVDVNHPLAGQQLVFEIELLEILEKE